MYDVKVKNTSMSLSFKLKFVFVIPYINNYLIFYFIFGKILFYCTIKHCCYYEPKKTISLIVDDISRKPIESEMAIKQPL